MKQKRFAVLYRVPSRTWSPWTTLGTWSKSEAQTRAGVLAVLGYEAILEEVSR